MHQLLCMLTMHQLLCMLMIQCCMFPMKAKIENDLHQDMQNLLSYFRKNELVINLKKGKTETMLFGMTKRLKNPDEIDVLYNNQITNFTETYKYLGNVVDHHLHFSENFEKSYKKTSSRLQLLE